MNKAQLRQDLGGVKGIAREINRSSPYVSEALNGKREFSENDVYLIEKALERKSRDNLTNDQLINAVIDGVAHRILERRLA